MSSKYRSQLDLFDAYLRGSRLSLRGILKLILGVLPEVIEGLIRFVPGALGYLIRRNYYRFRLKSLGKKSLIDVGVYLIGPKNIEIGDYTWIDAGVRIEATLGNVSIGKRVHIAPYVILGSREPIVIEDYVGISAGAKVYSNSEIPLPGLHMSGPMIPERFKSSISIPVLLAKDSFVGCNSVLLPGSSLGEGAVLGALSTLKEPIPNWEIWAGSPAKKISVRDNQTPLPNP